MRSILLALGLAVLMCGCASVSSVLKSKDEGTAQVYPVAKDDAWKISMTVLRWEGCETIEEHKDEGYMVTTFGQSFVSAGTIAAVWVEPMDHENTKVTVVTKRKVATNVATELTEASFHKRFAEAVEIVKEGKPLPIERPRGQTK
jgi:hypothetical protein